MILLHPVELDPEGEPGIARPASVDDARHGGLRIDPDVGARRTERDEELLTGEEADAAAPETIIPFVERSSARSPTSRKSCSRTT